VKLRTLLYCLVGGLPITVAALGAGHIGWFYLSGILLAASFVPVAFFGPRSAAAQFTRIAPVLLLVTVLCTWSEGILFVPAIRQHAIRDLVGSFVIYIVLAAVLAALGRWLNLNRTSQIQVPRRGPAAAVLLLLVCGLAYAVYYLVFGAITYQHFTRAYYPDAAKLIAPLGLWFWVLQIARGLLMTVAVVPVIYSLRMKRWQVALVVGLLVWIAGGAAPLLVPNVFMGQTQRLIHIVEIFTQNFSLGVTAVWLLRPSGPKASASSPVHDE
jgi:uncharacterized membrane protein YidH (DUF202 family)